MKQLCAQDWQERSLLYSFLANSFLKVMTKDTSVALTSEFWDGLLNDKQYSSAEYSDLRLACANLRELAWELELLESSKAVERVAVEYTRLFIGPPEPAAPPWETLYRQEKSAVLFGQPTFDMRTLLSKEGFEASKEAHQFEDHIGFELIYLAVRCQRFASELEVDASFDQTLWHEEQATFITQHPLSFIDALYEKALGASSVGYYAGLLQLTKAVLTLDAHAD